ncbi:MAG: hypothetical protein A2Z74_05910 [Chloroflexi bacterium RBG_13_46_9]|nr:MAG: hypothetical protein A2Z74_05910 [Chloroflexi bacterium RBG_13_46_9]
MRLKAIGFLLIFSGLLMMFTAVYMSWTFYRSSFLTISENPIPHSMAFTFIGVLGISGMIFGIITLLGGVNALRGRGWAMSFAGSIFSLIVPPLGLASGIMLVLERKDWSRTKRRMAIVALSILAFFVACFWVLAQFL